MGERYYENFFLPILVFCLLSFNVLADEIKSELLDAASKRISDILSTLPDEGIAEFDVSAGMGFYSNGNCATASISSEASTITNYFQ